MLAHVVAAWVILRFLYPRASAQRKREHYARWSEGLLRVLGVQLDVAGEPPPPGVGVLVAANHVSWLDIFAISQVRPTRFIAKSEIRDWPGVGWITERAGTIFIRRAKRHDTIRINELVHAAIAEGDCVGLFPEGTTTEGDRLLKFHSSLFEPAVANSAIVVPVAIRYEYPDGSLCRAAGFVGERSFAQSFGLIVRQKRIVARLTFAEPIATRGLTRREVAKLAQSRVASLLGLPEPGTEPRIQSDP